MKLLKVNSSKTLPKLICLLLALLIVVNITVLLGVRENSFANINDGYNPVVYFRTYVDGVEIDEVNITGDFSVHVYLRDARNITNITLPVYVTTTTGTQLATLQSVVAGANFELVINPQFPANSENIMVESVLVDGYTLTAGESVLLVVLNYTAGTTVGTINYSFYKTYFPELPDYEIIDDSHRYGVIMYDNEHHNTTYGHLPIFPRVEDIDFHIIRVRHVIRFLDRDGNPWYTQYVYHGGAGYIPPGNPQPPLGYSFYGWDPDALANLDNVTESFDVEPIFVPITHVITGTVTERLNSGATRPVPGLTITYTVNGGPQQTIVTGPDGVFTIGPYPESSTIIITLPDRPGFTIPQLQRTVNIPFGLGNPINLTFRYTQIPPSRPGGPGITFRPPFVEDYPPIRLTVEHYRYIFGRDDGTIAPEDNITREEVAAIFFRLLARETRMHFRRAESYFPDVPNDGDWAAMAIGTIESIGIVRGYNDGLFRPRNNITRAEFAVIAMRFTSTSDYATHNFPDVAGLYWAEREIASAVELGWIVGFPDGTFRPNQFITRAEAVTLINRVLGRHVDARGILPELITVWPDLDSSHWAYYDFMEATISHAYERRYHGELVENWIGPGVDIDFRVN